MKAYYFRSYSGVTLSWILYCVFNFPNHCSDYIPVFNNPTPNNVADTSYKLELHVDQPYLANCPKVLSLHNILNYYSSFSLLPLLHVILLLTS